MLYNVDDATPLADFVALLRRPRAFFKWFAGTKPLSYWVIGKAILGFVFLVWFAAFARGGRDVAESIDAISPIVDSLVEAIHERLPWLAADLEPGAMKAHLAVGVAAMAQLGVLLRPIMELLALLLTSTTAYFFLPFVGVPKSSRSFGHLFIVGVFANWFAWLGAIPGVGGPLATLAASIYYVLGVKWMHGISFWRSFLALYLLGWALIALTALFGVLVLMALLAALPHA